MAMCLRSAFVMVLAMFVVAGCASRPIVDTTGVDMQQYHADVEECHRLTEQVNGADRVVNSAGFGALIGALFGLVTGDPEAVAYGAGWGAVSGAASGGMSADQEKSMVMKNCLYNRGYAVLN